jgi:hypothetical protein
MWGLSPGPGLPVHLRLCDQALAALPRQACSALDARIALMAAALPHQRPEHPCRRHTLAREARIAGLSVVGSTSGAIGLRGPCEPAAMIGREVS